MKTLWIDLAPEFGGLTAAKQVNHFGVSADVDALQDACDLPDRYLTKWEVSLMSSFGMNSKAAALGTLFGGSLLLTAGLGLAQAEPAPPPPPGPDGLVNVVVGGATYLDSVPAAQATQAVADMCALSAPAVSAMVAEVDAAGTSQTACMGGSDGEVVLVQNLPPAAEVSPVVPGTSASTEEPAGDAPPEEVGGEPIPDTLPDESNNMPGMN